MPRSLYVKDNLLHLLESNILIAVVVLGALQRKIIQLNPLYVLFFAPIITTIQKLIHSRRSVLLSSFMTYHRFFS